MVDYMQSGKSSYLNGHGEHHVGMHGASRIISPLSLSTHSGARAKRSSEHEFDMELTYITEKIIALCFPDDGSEVTYRQNAKEVSDMLRAKHTNKYAIINLSGISKILDQNNPQVYEFGYPARLAPALEVLCSICRIVSTWLQDSHDHVVVFHCKGGIDRLACVLAAYVNYSSIHDQQSEALNRFAMKQFFDEQLAKWLQPSQARYVQYFTQLLTGSITIRSEPVYLQHIMLHQVPQGADERPMNIFVKVYANMKPVYTSHVLKLTQGQTRVCVSLNKPLELCGDILIKMFNKQSGTRSIICRVQLNTSTLNTDRLSLKKSELDVAISDPSFAEDGKLELIFCSPSSSASVSSEDFSQESQSGTLGRWDSYADFNSVTDDSPLDSPSGIRKSVRVSRYFEDGPLEDSLYSKAGTLMTSYSTMPVQTNGGMYSSSAPGHEYGITNVSSHGRVNITVIPPQKMGHQLSPAAFHTSPSDSQSNSSQSTHNQLRYYSNSSSPRSPPLASSTYNGNNSNNMNTMSSSSRHSERTVQTTTEFDPSVNRAGQHLHKSTSIPSGKEQNDLDEILRELLGESHGSNTTTTTTSANRSQHVTGGGDDSFVRERQQYTNPDGSTTTIEKRKYKAPNVTENVTINKTSSRKVHTTQNGSAGADIDSSGVSWLQQQQMKLNQRQRNRDDVDTTHRQEVVQELKTVHDRRAFSSSDSEQNDGQTYYSQKDIIVNQQPVAYTVLIKPEEEKRRQEEVRKQNETNLSKKSVTNVSHTHHTHYNFKDAEDSSEQRNKIRQLEDELRNVKIGLQQATHVEKKVETKPPRPPKQELEEEEILSFKPVGIASLESGTGATLPRVIPGPPPTSAGFEEEETISFKPVGVNTLESGTGQSFVHTNTMRSGSDERGHGMGGAHNGGGGYSGMGGANYTSGTMRSQPQSPMSVSSAYPPVFPPSPGTPYQIMSPHSPMRSASEYGMSTHTAPQRVVTESSRHMQQSYSQGGQQQMGGGGGYNQGMSQHTAADDAALGGQHSGGQRFGGYSTSHSYHSGMNQSGGHTGTLPHNQTLHVNTGEAKYATVGGQQAGGQGHVQFTNGGGVNHAGTQSYHSTGLRSNGSAYGGAAGSGYAADTGYSHEMFNGPMDSHVTAKFVKDTSKYWYKPTISRDEVINQLKDTVPGTFIVRDSNSFPGAFGLAVRVHQLPPNVHVKSGQDTPADYVRFYLIEPTPKGVKLKGCSNEPVFASLAALIYQHTITPLALPCKLLLPDQDRMSSFNVMADTVDGGMSGSAVNGEMTGSASELLKHGAACSVVYVNNVDTESLTGPQAVSRAVQQTFYKGKVDTTIATFKVSSDGITITDTNHRLFFRQHFPRESVSFCGVDPADRRFTQSLDNGMLIKEAKIFGFVAKKKKGGNHCLIFAELDPEQPASAVVNFVTKVMMNK